MSKFDNNFNRLFGNKKKKTEVKIELQQNASVGARKIYSSDYDELKKYQVRRYLEEGKMKSLTELLEEIAGYYTSDPRIKQLKTAYEKDDSINEEKARDNKSIKMPTAFYDLLELVAAEDSISLEKNRKRNSGYKKAFSIVVRHYAKNK